MPFSLERDELFFFSASINDDIPHGSELFRYLQDIKLFIKRISSLLFRAIGVKDI